MRLAAQSVRRSTDWVLQLINIVFLCLLFFLVNGTIASRGDREIIPPVSLPIGASAPPGDAVYINAAGLISFRGRQMIIPEIAQILHLEAKSNKAKTVEIVADHRLNANRLVDLLSEFSGLDIGPVSLVTLKGPGQ